MDDHGRADLVLPFYLDMMRTNAVEHGPDLLPALAEAGRAATAADVIALLHDPWRERVMGAWFALFHEAPEVAQAVLQALVTSHGSLDSPPLATAAVILSGRDALPALAGYAVNDSSYEWGACGFAAAAAERLGADSFPCEPGDRDRLEFTEMLALATQLRSMR